MNVIVLGAGRVGSAIAVDLARDPGVRVRVADVLEPRLRRLETSHGIIGVRTDLSSTSAVGRLVADADLVVDAVPGFLGFQTLRTVIEAEKNVVDIAFFPEDPFQLDEIAKIRRVTAVVDCGVAPGLSNLLVGHASGLLDTTRSVAIYVGGLPADRVPPYEYRAVFSPIDVIEEYTRPARVVERGTIVTKPALSDLDLLDFAEVGPLEAFVTDGLRTLTRTVSAPDMVEKTLRYPGHADKIRLLRDTGFFSVDPIHVDGAVVRPIDVTTALLFPLWQLQQGEEDLTVMKVVVEGSKDGLSIRYAYDLLDRFNARTNTTSMARTTGYTAAMTARMLTAGLFDRSGIVPPEYVGERPKCVEFILAGLRERGVVVRETVTPID
jgi:lysine 6-dehydrogenase